MSSERDCHAQQQDQQALQQATMRVQPGAGQQQAPQQPGAASGSYPDPLLLVAQHVSVWEAAAARWAC